MRQKTLLNKLSRIIFVLFLIAAAVTAVVMFQAVRSLVTNWNIPGFNPLRPFQPIDPEAAAAAGYETGFSLADFDATAPMQPPGGPFGHPWDGSDRITILLLGMDKRSWEEYGGPPRSDSIVVMTIDPRNNEMGMLSVPRDLWVSIPGNSYGKINTAYRVGELALPNGGGPSLAMQTVSDFLGIPIDFYIDLDFEGFTRILDEFGGVEVNIPEPIYLDPIGNHNSVLLQAGPQTLDGKLALAYVRNRNTINGDFDRSIRQQQVIDAIRKKMVSLDMLQIMVTKAPALYGELRSSVHTNFSMEQIIRLALVVQQIPQEKIKRGAISNEHVSFAISYDGQDILKPIPDLIRSLRDEILVGTGVYDAEFEDQDLFELVTQEGAQIAVLNATFQPALASRTTKYFESAGLQIAVTGNASETYAQTTIIDYTGNPYTLKFLEQTLNIQTLQIFHSFDPDKGIDLEVNLGDDWAANNPMPSP